MAIERVNVGFMAVTVPEGEGVTIEFTYRTPGLTLGFGITLVSLALLVAYLMLMHRLPQKAPPRRGPSLLRVGKFSQYAKSRHTSFRRPGALTLHVTREAAVPSEEDSPPPKETPRQSSQSESEKGE